MDKPKDSEIWVGKYGENKHVVYDPEMQSKSNVDRVYLFEVFSGQMVSYKKQDIRSQLVEVHDRRKKTNCTLEYLQWKDSRGYRFQIAVLQKKDVKSQKASYRNTKCWACGNKITSLNGDKCSKCGWLKCPRCGACEEGCSGNPTRE